MTMAQVPETDTTRWKALAEAVLTDALHQLALLSKQPDRESKQARKELIEWFCNDTEGRIFAFKPLCEWLGISPSALRKELKLKGKVLTP